MDDSVNWIYLDCPSCSFAPVAYWWMGKLYLNKKKLKRYNAHRTWTLLNCWWKNMRRERKNIVAKLISVIFVCKQYVSWNDLMWTYLLCLFKSNAVITYIQSLWFRRVCDSDIFISMWRWKNIRSMKTEQSFKFITAKVCFWLTLSIHQIDCHSYSDILLYRLWIVYYQKQTEKCTV